LLACAGVTIMMMMVVDRRRGRCGVLAVLTTRNRTGAGFSAAVSELGGLPLLRGCRI
jgi:hypothetical protein